MSSWQKIHLRLRSLAPQRCAERNRRRRLLARRSTNLCAAGAQIMRVADCKNLSEKPVRGFSTV